MLDWEKFDPAAFERAVQMLLRDQFGAVAIDGAGGDQAQDSRLITPDGLVIFEVKSFSKRLAGAQKKQIKHSLDRAVQLHTPGRWVLVTRSDPSAGDKHWLEQQAARHPACDVDWLGVDWLNLKIAGREDLISYLEGPEYKLLKRAKQFEWERAALTDGDALAERLSALGARGDEISPNWRWDAAVSGEAVTMILQPKTPHAAQLDPIVLRPMFTFPRQDPEALEVQQALDEFLRFGGDDVEVPEKYVAEFDIDTASDATGRLLGSSRTPSSLRFIGERDTTGLPVVVELTRVTPDGQRDALAVQLTHRLRGSEGSTLCGCDLNGVVDVRMQMPEQAAGKQGRLVLSLRPVTGRFAHQIGGALRWMVARTEQDTLEVSSGGLHLATFSAGPMWSNDITHLARLVEILQALERHAGRPVRIPEEILTRDLREIEQACHALGGSKAALGSRSLHVTVRPGQLRGFLDAVPEAPGGLYISHDLEWQIGDDVVTLADIATWCPAVMLANRAELEAISLDVTEHIAQWKAVEGSQFSFIRAVETPGEPWKSIPA